MALAMPPAFPQPAKPSLTATRRTHRTPPPVPSLYAFGTCHTAQAFKEVTARDPDLHTLSSGGMIWVSQEAGFIIKDEHDAHGSVKVKRTERDID